VRTFPLRRSRWAFIFLVPLAARRPVATVDDEEVGIRMGWLGSGTVPIRLVDAVGRMEWPWWGGVGVRIARGLVAFVAGGGPAAVLDLSEPVKVRAPMRWETMRIAIGAEDVEGLIEAIASARRRLEEGPA
jgi:hypothetical protein